MTHYSFRFIGSFLGEIDYEVVGDDAPYRATVRRRAESYERSIFNGDESEWRRDVISAIGTIHRRACDQPISSDVVAAFNQWLRAEHAILVAQIKSDPVRYGEIAESDPLLQPPVPVAGAHYDVGSGWVLQS